MGSAKKSEQMNVVAGWSGEFRFANVAHKCKRKCLVTKHNALCSRYCEQNTCSVYLGVTGCAPNNVLCHAHCTLAPDLVIRELRSPATAIDSGTCRRYCDRKRNCRKESSRKQASTRREHFSDFMWTCHTWRLAFPWMCSKADKTLFLKKSFIFFCKEFWHWSQVTLPRGVQIFAVEISIRASRSSGHCVAPKWLVCFGGYSMTVVVWRACCWNCWKLKTSGSWLFTLTGTLDTQCCCVCADQRPWRLYSWVTMQWTSRPQTAFLCENVFRLFCLC